MKTQNKDRRVRPLVLVLLGCLLAGIAIPVWIATRPAPVPEPTPETAEPAPPAPVATMTLPKRPVTTRVRVPRRWRSAAQAKVEQPVPPPPPPPPGLEERWGIQVCSMRLSMMNSIVDLRYKVLDPEKAAQLADGKTASYIVDPATGTKLLMPTPPKEGAFPPSANKMVAGKTYFSMVSNPRGALKSGSMVNIVIGDSLATNLTLQ